MFKKISGLVLGIIAVFGLAACTDLTNEVSGYYVSIDINPSIEFIVDEDDVVESYFFLNEDAEILCADLDFTGMNVDDAVELFIETATNAGYVDPEGEDNAVLITVIGEDGDEERVKTIKERIRTRAIRHLARRYINGVVLTEDFTQEDLVAEAELLGVTPGKLKLTYAVLAVNDEYTQEELLEMPVKDLMAMVKEFHGESWEDYKEERVEEMKERKREKIAEHKAIIDEYIANNPELTEEEIEQYIEEYKQQVREENKERWQERVEQWKQRRQERKENRENNENENQEDNSQSS